MMIRITPKQIIVALLLFLCNPVVYAQLQQGETDSIWKSYPTFKELGIKNRLFKHSDLQPLIKKHVQNQLLKDEILGNSVQGRSIHHLTAGKGKIKILMWSQMHGDESTATMALFDLFNFLAANDQYNSIRKNLLDRLEMHFVPMLNPDGAEIWTRRNNMNIDLNRDAKNLATPEANILMNIAKRLQPQFGFNLHDQSIFYNAGSASKEPATISFLAPAYNVAKDMDSVRTKAVQLIVAMNNVIQAKIPNKIAKYNDTHDSTCFGDTFQGMGISTVLIESGGFPNDPEKQEIRKVNFLALITALNTIASNSYLAENVNTYWALPNNSRGLYHLIIRNLAWPQNNSVKGDVAINRNQKLTENLRSMNYVGAIGKTGGLDSAYGYQEIDADQLNFRHGKVKLMTKLKWDRLTVEKELKLIKSGYLFVKWKDGPSPTGPIPNRLLNLTNATNLDDQAVSGKVNFILSKEKKPTYAVINGYLLDFDSPANIVNTMGY